MQIDLNAAWIIAMILVMARALAWMSVVTPFSSSATVPRIVLVGLAVGLALLAVPGLGLAGVPTGTLGILGALVVQVATGLALGLVVQTMLSAVTTAGSFLDLTGGLTLPPSMDTLTGQPLPIMSQFYQQTMIFLLFATGGYLVMVEGFVRSFAGPGFSLRVSQLVSGVMVTDLEVLFTSALEIAAPVLLVLFAAQIALALLAKAAPQTNVWFLGFPFQIFLVIALVGVTISALPNDVTNLLARAMGDAARLFGGR
ncbi:MAG: flagellar biosynthetic protein FliR [Actinomycetota bacterium]|nr:flagellar biosynthetic protein FliR [Actinomycetota bacterium]